VRARRVSGPHCFHPRQFLRTCAITQTAAYLERGKSLKDR
jgi:hypothetical protein